MVVALAAGRRRPASAATTVSVVAEQRDVAATNVSAVLGVCGLARGVAGVAGATASAAASTAAFAASFCYARTLRAVGSTGCALRVHCVARWCNS